jgi:hypothetical protein
MQPTDPAPLQPVVFDPVFENDVIACVVVIEGAAYLPVRATIEHNAHGATDSAECTLPISNNPDFSMMFARNSSNANQPVYIAIYCGYPVNPAPGSLDYSDLALRFAGIVDTYSAQFEADQVTFRCRSMAAPLVDLPISWNSLGQTTTELVTEMAQTVGLTPNIQLVTPPGVYVQQVFAQEFVGGANFAATVAAIRAWDLLLKTALVDDVDVWVDALGGVPRLNYCAPSLIPRATVDLTYGRHLESITTDHSIQYAKNIHVAVYSYNKRVRTSTTVSVDSALGGGTITTPTTKTSTSSPIFGTSDQVTTTTSANGVQSTSITTITGGHVNALTQPGTESAKENYVFYIPNLSAIDCHNRAAAIWRQISMQEYRQKFTIPMTRNLLFALDATGIAILFNITGLPYVNANSVYSQSGPIVNTATATSTNAPPVSSAPLSSANVDTRYWPRRMTETIDPQSAGWKITVEAVSHTPPQGAI